MSTPILAHTTTHGDEMRVIVLYEDGETDNWKWAYAQIDDKETGKVTLYGPNDEKFETEEELEEEGIIGFRACEMLYVDTTWGEAPDFD